MLRRQPAFSSLCPILLGAALTLACGPDEEARCEAPPGHVCTVVGTGDLGFNGDGHAATDTDLYLVSVARRGPDERLYVMDFNNQRLRVVADDDRVITLVGDGEHALAAVDTPALESPLENPIDFRFMHDERLVFVSYHDPRVLVEDEDGKLQALAGSGEVGENGDEGDEGPAEEAMFIQLDGIAVKKDVIYVSDSKAHRVRKIEDGIVTTVAGNGEAEYAGDDRPGPEASLNWPTALELDDEGNLFIADARNHAVRRLAKDGTITTIAGTGKKGYSGDGGPATEAQLNQPYGLAWADGTLYIADRANFVVRQVLPDGTIETFAGTGEEGMDGDGGLASDAEFSYLARLSLDGDGLLVADQSNSLVRRITLP